MCNCIELTNDALVPRNQRLPYMTSLTDGSRKVYVTTEVCKPKRGERAMKLICTYCPFCGVAYATDQQQPGDAAPEEG
jgi:hypothetical protein